MHDYVNNPPIADPTKDAEMYARVGAFNESIAEKIVFAGGLEAPSTSTVVQERDGQLLIVSGDDGALVDFEPKSAHPGFPKDVLAYDLSNDRWARLDESPLSRATTLVVKWNGMAVIPSGEIKPGRRTPEVWGLNLR
jgi:hypothetical protein